MHQRLDSRMPLDGDAQLRRHADACAECRGELEAWQQIASVLPAARPAPRRALWRRRSSRAAVALAASVLMLWTLQPAEPPPRSPETPPGPQRSAAVQAERALAYPSPSADSQQWWSQVREREWLDSALPAVRSVGEGVAPLGRSLLQAVAILAQGQGAGTS